MPCVVCLSLCNSPQGPPRFGVPLGAAGASMSSGQVLQTVALYWGCSLICTPHCSGKIDQMPEGAPRLLSVGSQWYPWPAPILGGCPEKQWLLRVIQRFPNLDELSHHQSVDTLILLPFICTRPTNSGLWGACAIHFPK